MKSIIMCEGSTDLVLVQHFMQLANGWNYKRKQSQDHKPLGCQNYRKLAKENSELEIIGVGGCSKIIPYLRKAIERNTITQSDSELYHNIVIISDKDEVDTITDFEHQISSCLSEFDITYSGKLENDTWIICHTNHWRGPIVFRIVMLIIPFEDTGALETFLLNAVAEKDAYDAQIISGCNKFVDDIDPDKKYLAKRRHLTKAKFDVYFSVRTPLEQFAQRRDILKGVNWFEYESIQKCFMKLKDL